MCRSTSRSQLMLALGGLVAFGILPSCGGSSKTEATQGPNAVDKPLFLIGALNVDATQCIFDSSGPLLANGTLDLTFGSTYAGALLVENPYAQGAASGSATETERVSLSRAEITLSTSDGAVLGQHSAVGTGFIDAAPIGSGAYGTMAVTLIPAELGASDAVQNAHALIARIHVVGEALNGLALSSNDIDFPITVCNGCLVRSPAEAADPTVPSGQTYLCSTSSGGLHVTTPAPCILGQDTPFPCVYCSAEFSLCRDPTRNPSL